MPVSVVWKWKADEYPQPTGSSISRSSPQEAFDEQGYLLPLNRVECENARYPLYDAPPPCVLGRAGALCARALPAGARYGPPPVCLLSVRGRATPMSGPGVCAAGYAGNPRPDGPHLPAAPRARPPSVAGPHPHAPALPRLPVYGGTRGPPPRAYA